SCHAWRSPWRGRSDLDALAPEICNHRLEAALLDRAHAAGRDAQADPAPLLLQPEPLGVQVRQEAPPALVVRVRDAVTDRGLLARDIADAGHLGDSQEKSRTWARAGARGPHKERGFIAGLPGGRNRPPAASERAPPGQRPPLRPRPLSAKRSTPHSKP